MNKGRQREENLSRDVYFSDGYFAPSQLWSFCEQIRHIRQFSPASFLEIGPGNGFVSTFFRTMGITVRTADVNPALKPDIVAPVQDLWRHVSPNEFPLIVCCEVLEHIPFDEFPDLIRQISSLAPDLFLTLPVYGRRIGFGGLVRLPKVNAWFGSWLRLPIRERGLEPMHFWELDYRPETSRQAVRQLLQRHYSQVSTGFFTANPTHYYFSCRGSLLHKAGSGGGSTHHQPFPAP